MTEEPKKLEAQLTRIDWETGELTLKFEPGPPDSVLMNSNWLQCGWRYLIEPKP